MAEGCDLRRLYETMVRIRAIEVDCGVGDQPTLLGFQIEDDGLFAAHLQQLALEGTIRLRVEILDGLADT